ncbi:MAG: hypothetical protein ACJ8F1_13905 [Polyangia bacterium]
MRRFYFAKIFAFAVAGLGACGSGGSTRAPAGPGGQADADGAPNGMFARVDAGAADQPHDAAPTFSCAGAADAGATCIQFDPDYPDPAGACAAQQAGPVVDAPCAPEGSAGGCHVAAGTSGYTIWRYGRQTAGALIVRCQQLGESYVSPGFDVTVDASARATGPAPGASQF